MHDFYSDTKTKPTRGMLESVLAAEFGDEQKNEDPTTMELCRRVAEILGKEAAVFLPSGTMCNEIAIQVHILGEVAGLRRLQNFRFETRRVGAVQQCAFRMIATPDINQRPRIGITQQFARRCSAKRACGLRIDEYEVQSKIAIIAAAPYSWTMRAGVPNVDPPNRCCWIMQSSQMLHGTPEAAPPRNAPPTWTASLSLELLASNFWKKPVPTNCTAFVPPRFMQAMGNPL